MCWSILRSLDIYIHFQHLCMSSLFLGGFLHLIYLQEKKKNDLCINYFVCVGKEIIEINSQTMIFFFFLNGCRFNSMQVVFKTDIYGTFRQSIVFDFGFEAILMREVQVESAPATDAEKIRKDITLTEAHRWNERTVTLVPFEPR